MKSHSLWISRSVVAFALGIALTGCATQRADPANDPANIQTEPGSAELRSDRVRNWTVVDDQTLLIEAYDGTRYKAEMMGACNGLSFATRLGFSSRGGFKQIDRFSAVMLPDGTRCPLATFNKVKTAESSALDRYEKSAKEGDGADKDGKAADPNADKKDAGKAADEKKSAEAGSASPR